MWNIEERRKEDKREGIKQMIVRAIMKEGIPQFRALKEDLDAIIGGYVTKPRYMLSSLRSDSYWKDFRQTNPETFDRICNFSKAVAKTIGVDREVLATQWELMHEYAGLMSKYGKFMKKDPEKASMLLEAIELGKPVEVAGRWGLSDDFIKHIKKFGVTVKELETVPEDKYGDLILERIAMVDVIK